MSDRTLKNFAAIEIKAIEDENLIASKDVTSSLIGDFGRWQSRISIMMGLLKLSIAWFQLGIVFLAPPQKFWCKKPDIFANHSNAQWINMSKPITSNSHCDIYDPTILINKDSWNTTDIQTVPCTEFEYDTSIFATTIVSEWDLVCSNQYYVEFSQVTLMLGVLIGSLVFGLLGDKYGRRKTLFVAIAMQAVAGFFTAFTPWLFGFLAARFVLAMASGGIAIISFVICMEVVGGVWRTIIPILYQIPFGLGNSVMAGLAYVLRDWRHLQISLSALSSLYLLFYFAVPESPRWLLATGQNENAVKVLEKICVCNKRDTIDIRRIVFKHSINVQKLEDKDTFGDALKSKNMRNKIILLCIQWFISGLCFFAFSQQVGMVGRNIFLTVITSGLVVIPGALMCIPIVQRYGYKRTLVVSQLAVGTCFLLISAVPKGVYPQDWPRMVILGFTIFGLSIALPTLCLHTGEIFPTVIRNAGIGCTSMFSRIGSMISPFVALLEKFAPSYPFVILAVLTALQTILLYPLPETKGRPLPDTIEQAEKLDKNTNRKRNVM